MSILSLVRRLASLPPAVMAVSIFLVAFTIRNLVAWLLGFYAHPVIFGELELIGKSLAETGVFGNPYKIPTGPTAHGAPFYPYLLSLFFQWFGYGTAARAAVLVCATGFTSLAFALLPLLAVRTGIPAWIGGAAGLFAALIPFRAITELSWEVPYAVTGWIAALIVTIGWLRQPEWKRSVGCGAAWGAMFWVAPQLLPPFLLILLSSVWTLGGKTALRAVPAVMLTAILVIAPWIVRGKRELGAWFFVRNNTGLELAVANFPGAAPDYIANCQSQSTGYCSTRHPYTNAAEAALVLQAGEVEYHRGRMREALGFIAAEPAAFANRTARRVLMFWFPSSGGPLPFKDVILYPTTLLAFFGAWRMWRERPDAGRVFAACLAGFPIPYYFVNYSSRYIAPISWLVFFLAAYGASVLARARTIESR